MRVRHSQGKIGMQLCARIVARVSIRTPAREDERNIASCLAKIVAANRHIVCVNNHSFVETA